MLLIIFIIFIIIMPNSISDTRKLCLKILSFRFLGSHRMKKDFCVVILVYKYGNNENKILNMIKVNGKNTLLPD